MQKIIGMRWSKFVYYLIWCLKKYVWQRVMIVEVFFDALEQAR